MKESNTDIKRVEDFIRSAEETKIYRHIKINQY
jgi:hypothetical protein